MGESPLVQCSNWIGKTDPSIHREHMAEAINGLSQSHGNTLARASEVVCEGLSACEVLMPRSVVVICELTWPTVVLGAQGLANGLTGRMTAFSTRSCVSVSSTERESE